MNKKQFTEHIGNIDERLVWQAEQLPNYRQQHRKKRLKGFAAVAAAVVLMVSSFSVGAFAFAREIVVEVPAKQETVTLEEINLTMLLPDGWSGKYSVEKYSVGKNDQNYVVYNKQIRESVSDGTDPRDGGVLFYIVCYEEVMTAEQYEEKGYDFVGYRYLFSTRDKTYILCYASDVQWDVNDPGQEAMYQKMESEVKDIRFIVDNALID